MTGSEFRAALEKLGLLQGEAAAFLGISIRTANNYANGRVPIPESIDKLFRLMAAHEVKVSDFAKLPRGKAAFS